MSSNNTSWQPMHGKGMPSHTISGNIQALYGLYSPELNDNRDIFAYLPPSYEFGSAIYPVIYMHDGQNLFDQAISYSKEWCVDEIMENLSREKYEAIIIGISNGRDKRMIEYNPYFTCNNVNQGELHLRFITNTVKPIIDSTFRTRPERIATGIIGSSMGALASLYAFFHYSHIFGSAAAISHWMWIQDQISPEVVFDNLHQAKFTQGKLYIDIGDSEYVDSSVCGQPVNPQRIISDSRQLKDLLVKKGYTEEKDLLYREIGGGGHSENDWSSRLPDIFKFFLSDI